MAALAGSDLWFHVEGFPGCHVVLHSGAAMGSEEDVRFCEDAARSHSKRAPPACLVTCARGVDVAFPEPSRRGPRRRPGTAILTPDKGTGVEGAKKLRKRQGR
jgi:hypothetical protein